MLVRAWMVFPLSISGIWVLKFCNLPKRRNLCDNEQSRKQTNTKTKKHINRDLGLFNVDHAATNAKLTHFGALLYICEDNEAVIKIMIKGRSPTLRHVSRTHGVALDWFFDRSNLEPKIQIKYIDTKNQFVDILTKGNFTRDEWNHLLCLFNISHFSSTDCSEVMSKRTQKDSGEERVAAKSKPMMNFGIAMQRKDS